jgi:hypothetical protein
MTLWDLLKPLKDAVLGPDRPAPPKKPVRAKAGVVKPGPGPTTMASAGSKGVVTVAPPTRRPPVRKRRVQPSSGVMEIGKPAPTEASLLAPARRGTPLTMEERYEAMVREMLAKYDVRVRKWRTSMSGIAWYVTYRDGHVQRLIESPRPKGPMSAAIFLHEIGHHAIGFNVYKPRCLEEYHAWQFSLREMERLGLSVTEGVKTRVYRSLRYAVAKAQRRGIREVPVELLPYMPATKTRS